MFDRAKGFLFWALLGLLIWPFVYTYGPTVEGRIFPVVVSTKLTRVTAVEKHPDRAIVYGSSRKIRGSCVYKDIEWYYGRPNEAHVLVPVDIVEPAKLRADGRFTFGPWEVHLSPGLIKSNSYAIVRHSCHPFWDTYTWFWP